MYNPALFLLWTYNINNTCAAVKLSARLFEFFFFFSGGTHSSEDSASEGSATIHFGVQDFEITRFRTQISGFQVMISSDG